MRPAALLGLALAAALGSSVAPARAQSLFPQRYVACHEPERRRKPPPQPAHDSPAPDLEPIARGRAPEPLRAAPLLVIDVPMAQPIPERRSLPAPAAPPPERWAADSGHNDYKCVGYLRGRRGIVATVSAPPGTRWHRHGPGEGYRLDNIRAAGAFATAEARAALERIVDRPIPTGLEGWREFELANVKLHAAFALAELGVRSDAPRLLAVARELERGSYPGLWSDCLEPLARLDRSLAQRYAVELLGKVERGTGNTGRDELLLRTALPLVTERAPEAVAVLRRLSQPLGDLRSDGARTEQCRILAARIRAGDDALRDAVRPELGTDLRTDRSVTCYSELIAAAFPGADPDELDVLMLRGRYDAIIRLLARMRVDEHAGRADARVVPARARLQAWLAQEATGPEIVAGQGDRRFDPERRARHLVARTLLADARAATELGKLVADPADDGVAPWLGARYLLDLDLPRAAELAAARLRIAITQHTDRHSREPIAHRGAMLVTEHAAVIEALAARGDVRFTLGLLDREGSAREAALMQLARRAPAEACELVAGAAAAAEREAVEDAFWALSLLGTSCRATMQRLATDASAPNAVRGMALESLAMMRDGAVPELLRDAGKGHPLWAWQWRARVILDSSP